jgi:hypothetical protein
VTVVAAHRVKPGRERDFERWENGITAAAGEFPGYLGSDLLRPVEGVQDDWVVVFRFSEAPTLHGWLDSSERAKWLADGDDLFERVDIHKVGTGLGGWFPSAVVTTEAPAAPPDYKQAMAVLLALYPIVMVLTLYVAPRLESLPFAANMFLNNVLSVAILQWLLMPLVTRWLGPWLDDTRGRLTVLGILGLLAAYAAMVAGFMAMS